VNDGTAGLAGIAIRAARADDFVHLQEIELEAGRVFADVGMEAIAAADPFPVAVLADYAAAGRAWVAADAHDRPIAYVVVDLVDGNAHVEQVSVRPDFGHRGIGRALIEAVAQWARAHAMPALTLTTFRDVAWNAPYYERCGFRTLATHEITPGLVVVRSHEDANGLDQWPRVCMRRELPP
jgi:GNAT superfamily N-acetyltransferase